MIIKETIKQLLRRASVYAYFAPPDIMTEHLRQLLQVLGVNCVIDVGAHYGEYGRLLRRLGYTGRIVSFEPTSEALARLRPVAAADNHWQVMPCALGAVAGDLDINIAGHTVFNSFLSASKFSAQAFGAESAVLRKERVHIDTLDACFDECVRGLASPSVYLKLDTQGFDLEVLKGASAVLPRVSGLQSEVSVQPIYDGMPPMAEAVPAYQAHGFRVTGLYAVTRERDLAVVEFDCMMRR